MPGGPMTMNEPTRAWLKQNAEAFRTRCKEHAAEIRGRVEEFSTRTTSYRFESGVCVRAERLRGAGATSRGLSTTGTLLAGWLYPGDATRTLRTSWRAGAKAVLVREPSPNDADATRTLVVLTRPVTIYFAEERPSGVELTAEAVYEAAG